VKSEISLDSSSDVSNSLSSLVERALEDADGLSEVEVDSHSSWRVALFDCLRPIDGVSVPGYEPSQNCKQSWGGSWSFLDHRTLGLEVEPFLKESMMIHILDMLDSPCLAQTCSVSVWWRRTIRNHFLRRLFAGRLDHRTRGCGFYDRSDRSLDYDGRSYFSDSASGFDDRNEISPGFDDTRGLGFFGPSRGGSDHSGGGGSDYSGGFNHSGSSDYGW